MLWFNAGKNGLPYSAWRCFCGKVVAGWGKHFIFPSRPTAQLNNLLWATESRGTLAEDSCPEIGASLPDALKNQEQLVPSSGVPSLLASCRQRSRGCASPMASSISPPGQAGRGRAAGGRAARCGLALGSDRQTGCSGGSGLALPGEGRSPARAVPEQQRRPQPGTTALLLAVLPAQIPLSPLPLLFFFPLYIYIFFPKPLWNRRPLLAPVGAAVE